MDLILTVTAGPDGANMLNHTKAFDQNGGTVGRADSNNWVLPDPTRVVSSRHAVIAFKGGNFELQDASTNGTYLNDSAAPIGSGNTQALSDGDIIVLGDYKLKVTIKAPKPAAGLATGLEAADFLDSGDKTTFSATSMAKMQSQSEAKELDSWLEADKPATPVQGGDDWGFLNDSNASDPFAASSPDPLAVDPMAAQPSSGFGGNTDPFAASGDPLGGFAQTADNSGINSANVDPLAAFGSPQDSSPAAGADPLAALDQAQGHVQPQSAGWDDGDDWWKNSSESDHVPADQQMMQAPKPAVPVTPTPEPIPAAPTPAAAPTPPPIPEPNPFAASQLAVQGHNIDSAASLGAAPLSQAAAQMVPPQPAVPQPQVAPQTPAQPAADAWGQPQAAQPLAQPVAPQPAAQQATPVGADASALAAALGLNPLQAQQLQQLIPESAEIINETANRLIDLLRARNSIKNELRVQRTMIQTADNNPLKFSASAADALNAMFNAGNTGNSAFMRPCDAVSDSFDDLSDHQVAVLSGMRAAYDSMFEQFSPEKIERRINSGGGLLSSKGAKNWEGYKNLYADLRRDPDSAYGRLFGEEFASSYERQLAELKNARAMRRTQP